LAVTPVTDSSVKPQLISQTMAGLLVRAVILLRLASNSSKPPLKLG
jgi:hypothetical protein